MRLRTRLSIGMGVILTAALVSSLVLMLVSMRRMILQEVYVNTEEQAKNVTAEFAQSVSNNDLLDLSSDLTRMIALKYYFSVLADGETEDCFYVMQQGTKSLYNNSGLDVYSLLSENSKEFAEPVSDWMDIGLTNQICQAQVTVKGVTYYIAGLQMEMEDGSIFTLAVVRDLTATMQELYNMAGLCVAIGVVIELLALAAAYLFLSHALHPLESLRQEAQKIAEGNYGGRVAVKKYTYFRKKNPGTGKPEESNTENCYNTENSFEDSDFENSDFENSDFENCDSVNDNFENKNLKNPENSNCKGDSSHVEDNRKILPEKSKKIKKNQDEIESLADEFNRMAEAVQLREETITQQITEVKSAYEKQDLLLHALAHEMRTPVTAITGYAYLLDAAKITEEQRTEAIQFINLETRRLERLSEKLTQLVGLEQVGQADAQEKMETISFADLEERLSMILMSLAQKYSIQLSFSVDRTASITGDPDLLLVLFTNLFDNARKADASRIKIHLQATELSVIDNGCGIPQEQLAKIMQPFYQGDSSRSEEGFGLGLAICQKIAQMHGMQLAVESTREVGSKFSLKY